MDDLNEDGNAFAIPKLWKVSTLVQFNEESEDPQILDLEPLSRFLSITKAVLMYTLLIQTNRTLKWSFYYSKRS